MLPDHPAWAEIGHLDPRGEGSAWCELRIGERVQLSRSVQRLTHAGGNAYLVGDASNGWVVIDPCGTEELHEWMADADCEARTVVRTGQPLATESIHLGNALTLKPVATPGGTAWLLVEERMAFTGRWRPQQSEASSSLLGAADWIAPLEGFLVQLA